MSTVAESRCKNCGLPVVFVQKHTGSWHRPVELVEETGYLQIDSEYRLREARGLFKVHECDPERAGEYEKVSARESARAKAWHEHVQSIDCPHPRCNGVAGGPCKSLVDGETDLLSFHDQRRREAHKQGLLDNLLGD